jgi:hypothetical protein
MPGLTRHPILMGPRLVKHAAGPGNTRTRWAGVTVFPKTVMAGPKKRLLAGHPRL